MHRVWRRGLPRIKEVVLARGQLEQQHLEVVRRLPHPPRARREVGAPPGAMMSGNAARVACSFPRVAFAFVPTPRASSGSPLPDANSTLPSLGLSATTEGTREACAG